jgi:hypothetical protein
MEGFSEKFTTFIQALYEQKKVTRRDIPIGAISYYFWVGKLKEKKIIELDGINDKQQHIHVLTPKGKKVAELLIELDKLVNGEEDN